MRYASLLVLLAACQTATSTRAPARVVVSDPPEPTPLVTTAGTETQTHAANDPYVDMKWGEYDDDRIVGFSEDDKYVGWSISTCDPCPTEHHFRGPGVPNVDLANFYRPDLDEATQERLRKQNDDMVERRLKTLGAVKATEGRALRGPFPSDLIFASKIESDEKTKTATVLFGARVVGEKEPVFPMRVPLGPHPMLHRIPKGVSAAEWNDQWGLNDPRVVYANVTKDGKEIAVVAITGGSMWWEDGGFARMKTDEFVAKVRAKSAQ